MGRDQDTPIKSPEADGRWFHAQQGEHDVYKVLGEDQYGEVQVDDRFPDDELIEISVVE